MRLRSRMWRAMSSAAARLTASAVRAANPSPGPAVDVDQHRPSARARNGSMRRRRNLPSATALRRTARRNRKAICPRQVRDGGFPEGDAAFGTIAGSSTRTVHGGHDPRQARGSRRRPSRTGGSRRAPPAAMSSPRDGEALRFSAKPPNGAGSDDSQPNPRLLESPSPFPLSGPFPPAGEGRVRGDHDGVERALSFAANSAPMIPGGPAISYDKRPRARLRWSAASFRRPAASRRIPTMARPRRAVGAEELALRQKGRRPPPITKRRTQRRQQVNTRPNWMLPASAPPPRSTRNSMAGRLDERRRDSPGPARRSAAGALRRQPRR